MENGRFFKRLFGMAPLHYRSNPDLSLLDRIKRGERALVIMFEASRFKKIFFFFVVQKNSITFATAK